MPSRSRGAPKQQLSPRQRGLDHSHDLNRGRLLARHVDGKRCWWCGQPMFKQPERNWDKQPLAADHTRSRAKYGIGRTHADRLLHSICNKQRGDGSRDDQRPALITVLTEQPTNEPPTNEPALAIGWPWPAPLPTHRP